MTCWQRCGVKITLRGGLDLKHAVRVMILHEGEGVLGPFVWFSQALTEMCVA